MGKIHNNLNNFNYQLFVSPAQSNHRSSSPCSMMTNIVGVTESTATMFPSLVIARPATISMYLMAIFLTKWPCLVNICILLRSLPRSQTTNLPVDFITATFLTLIVCYCHTVDDKLLLTLDTTIAPPLSLQFQTGNGKFHSSQKLGFWNENKNLKTSRTEGVMSYVNLWLLVSATTISSSTPRQNPCGELNWPFPGPSCPNLHLEKIRMSRLSKIWIQCMFFPPDLHRIQTPLTEAGQGVGGWPHQVCRGYVEACEAGHEAVYGWHGAGTPHTHPEDRGQRLVSGGHCLNTSVREQEVGVRGGPAWPGVV